MLLNYIFISIKESVRFTATSKSGNHNGARVDGYSKKHWNAPNGYYFKSDGNKWDAYFGSVSNGITVKQCRGSKKVWEGKIRVFNDHTGRRWNGADGGNWRVFDRIVKTTDNCAKSEPVCKRWPGVLIYDGSWRSGKYFKFDMTEWKNYFGSFSSSSTPSIKQCRNGAVVYTGKIRVWDNEYGKHGRREPSSSASNGNWKTGDYIVKSGASCSK